MINSTEQNPALSKPATLNSATLNKALTKPPPLSSLLNNNNAPKIMNGSLSTSNSSLNPSPSILQQQSQPLIGSNLIAQSKKSLEFSSQSFNNSLKNLSLNNSNNQLPSTSALFQNFPLQNPNKSSPHLSTQNVQPNGQSFQQQPNNLVNNTPVQFNTQLNSSVGLSSVPSNNPQLAKLPTSLLNNQITLAPNTAPYQIPPTISQVRAAPQFESSTSFNQSSNSVDLIQKNTQLEHPLSGNPQKAFQSGVAMTQDFAPSSIGLSTAPTYMSQKIAPPIGPPILNSASQPAAYLHPPTAFSQSIYPAGSSTLGSAGTISQSAQISTNFSSKFNGPINQQQQQNLSIPQSIQKTVQNHNFLNNRNNIPQYEQQQNQPLQFQQLNNIQMRSQPNAIDLLREKKLVHAYEDEDNDIPRPLFPHEFYTQVNCHADTIRCTLSSIPETQQLLQKSRLPLGLLIHPFKDLESLKVVQSSIIVRCRNCRSYINPYVNFLDNSKWRCNLCYSINDRKCDFLTVFFLNNPKIVF